MTAWIALVSPAVSTAMVASSPFLDHGVVERLRFGESAAMVVAIVAIVAIVAVQRTRNVSMAVLVGLPAYWLAGSIGWA